MKTKVSIIVTLLLLLIIITGCKKYEEGPWISFRKAERRIERVWKLESFKINDIEHVNDVIQKFGDTYWFIYADSDLYYEFLLGCAGKWTLTLDKKEIQLDYYKDCQREPIGPIRPNTVSRWRIDRLTMDEFWISTTYNDTLYYIKLT